MTGKTILHYKILEKIGAGAMGVVYKARDLKLNRLVALKFLPQEAVGNSEAVDRFINEAQTASALDHANICTIHEINETEAGQMFIGMAYYDGQMLKEKIKDGPMELEEAIEIARQIVTGLQRAHQAGIIHRDIKPGNIIITQWREVKILDFGIARLAGQDRITKTGATPGTVAYMSPEQLLQRAVDHRTDIWSLGVVLYEMLSGQLPFRGDHDAATIYLIVNKAPKPVTEARKGVTPELERIVTKCLAKNPDERYQRLEEMLVDLNDQATDVKSGRSKSEPITETRPKRKRIFLYAGITITLVLLILAILLFTNRGEERAIDSIAVLPLENFSGDLKQEYFADGMTEALIAELAQISSLRVISRTSVMEYKGIHKPLSDIARELNVDAILEGSVFQDSQRVRITVQLIEASTDWHLWAQSYERDLRDILALHSDIARAIAREIKIKIATDEERRLATARQVNPAAYEAYLKGRYHLQHFATNVASADQLRTAIDYYQQAIELNPDWAPAHAALASAYHFLASSQNLSEFYPKSKAAALRALEIDETISQAHSSLAFVLHHYEWDWETAEREYRRAIELEPNSHAWPVAIFFSSAGYYEDAIRWYQRAAERYPLSLGVKAQLGKAYVCAGQYDQAIAHLQNTLELNPNNAWARHFLVTAYLRKSMYEEAIRESQKAVAAGAGEPEFLAQLGYAYAVAGRRSEALTVLNQYEKKNSDHFVNELAALYIALGWKNKALALLRKAFEMRSAELLYIKCSALSDSLQDNPLFKKILRGINFPEKNIQIEPRK